jgi:GntR family transcriptional regulator
MPMIEHSSNIPYYVQLTTVIKDKIRRQEWRAGSKIPGDMELSLQAGVSRTVVRQALRELDYAGSLSAQRERHLRC